MSFLSQPLSFISIPPQRTFAGFSGYVTINETTTDALEITQQPIQNGASIADHAFKKPIGFSAQYLFSDNLTQSLSGLYTALQNLQVSFTPFSVITPKRTYSNMLLAILGQTTDKKTENCLSLNLSFQEALIVSVGTTIVPRSQLRNPGSNGGTTSVGNKSALLVTAQGIGAAFQ